MDAVLLVREERFAAIQSALGAVECNDLEWVSAHALQDALISDDALAGLYGWL